MYASLRMYVPSLPPCAANTDVGRVERAQGLESAGPSVGRFKVVLTRESLLLPPRRTMERFGPQRQQ